MLNLFQGYNTTILGEVIFFKTRLAIIKKRQKGKEEATFILA
jgi:hypothetical protein